MSTAIDSVAMNGANAALPILDQTGLRRALAEANVPTLLMVYTLYTQDEPYLERFSPHIRSIFSPEPTEIPEHLAHDLRERLFALLTSPTPPAERKITPQFMRKMMSVSVGEEVAAEFVPVLFDQMGFEKQVPRKLLPGREKAPAGFNVLVIGAGMTGIAAGIKLDEAGYDYTIIEKNAEVGGTWLENVYPGVGVDTPSHFYSYSFELNPEWSHYHPKGPEIQAYLSGVARKYGIHKHVVFNTRVISCSWDDARSLWHVVTRLLMAPRLRARPTPSSMGMACSTAGRCRTSQASRISRDPQCIPRVGIREPW